MCSGNSSSGLRHKVAVKFKPGGLTMAKHTHLKKSTCFMCLNRDDLKLFFLFFFGFEGFH